jgi:glycosyltransferase involved in cell wall biosynthesis
MSPIIVSILICTRNRAESLRETLAAIGTVDMPTDLPTELLVIDNGSTDSTREVVAKARLANVKVRYICEPRTGQCYARNRGLAESTGEVILFTDDDVRPPEGWVRRICGPILAGEADAIAGGVVFPSKIAALLAGSPYSARRGWFASTEDINPESPDRMVGANMAFGRHVLKRVAGFDTELGPGALGFCDETLFAFQLQAAGFRIGAQLDAAVEHHFDTSRLNRSAMLSTAERMGRSFAYVAYHWEGRSSVPTWTNLLRARAGLFIRRCLHPQSLLKAGTPQAWELDRVMAIAFSDQFRRETARPRKYAGPGPRKFCGKRTDELAASDAVARVEV